MGQFDQSAMSDPATSAEQTEPSGAERRRHVRVEVPLRARVLTKDGAEQSCLVVNISAGGVLLKAKAPPPEHCSVIVYIDQIGRFEGRVVRSGRHSFAVDYRARKARAAKIVDALTEIMNIRGPRHDRRLEPRIRHDSHTTVVLESGVAIPCSILDISLTGASIEIEPRPALGAAVTLGRMAAKVVRRHEKGVAVVFNGPAKSMRHAMDTSAAEDGAPFALGSGAGFGKKRVSP